MQVLGVTCWRGLAAICQAGYRLLVNVFRSIELKVWGLCWLTFIWMFQIFCFADDLNCFPRVYSINNCINLQSPIKSFTVNTGVLGTVYATKLIGRKLYVGTNQGLFYKNYYSNFFLFVFSNIVKLYLHVLMDAFFVYHYTLECITSKVPLHAFCL